MKFQGTKETESENQSCFHISNYSKKEIKKLFKVIQHQNTQYGGVNLSKKSSKLTNENYIIGKEIKEDTNRWLIPFHIEKDNTQCP